MTDTKLTSFDNQADNQIDTGVVKSLSVSDVAKRLEMNRGTLYNRIKVSDSYDTFKATGVTGDNNAIFYTETAWRELLSDVGLGLPEIVEQSSKTNDTPVETASITVIEGNHRQTLANIDLNNNFDLGTLRSPLQTTQTYQDPLAMAQQLIAQNQERVAAMNADLERQQAQVDASTQAIAMVEQSNFQLMQQTLNYQMESRIQALALNQNTTQLQQKIAVQQSLGKPAGSVSEQSQQ